MEKQDFITGVLPKLYPVILGIPSVVQNAPSLGQELADLKNDPNRDDLVAYVIASVAGVTDDAKAVKVLGAILVAVEHVVSDVIAIKNAIES